MKKKVKKIINLICDPLSILLLIKGFAVYYWQVLIFFYKKEHFKEKSIICFNYENGIYSDFYINIYRQLKQYPSFSLVLLFNTRYPNWYFDNRFSKDDFVPKQFLNKIPKCIVIHATGIEPRLLKKRKDHVYIQINHGFGSIGTAVDETYFKSFDFAFVTTQYQYYQLTQGPYVDYMKNGKVVKVGYPKIDRAFLGRKEEKAFLKIKSIFYGPTYHKEISSIFTFFDNLVNYAVSHNVELFVKLHPLLLYKYDSEKSGNIDWEKKIKNISKSHSNIHLLNNSIPFEEVVTYFYESDVFITDNSGLGYEFSIITGKPILFLGDNLKIPLSDLREKNFQKYGLCPEINLRGKVGPIIKCPSDLEIGLEEFSKDYKKYVAEVEIMKQTFTYNLGTASIVAANEIRQMFVDNFFQE